MAIMWRLGEGQRAPGARRNGGEKQQDTGTVHIPRIGSPAPFGVKGDAPPPPVHFYHLQNTRDTEPRVPAEASPTKPCALVSARKNERLMCFPSWFQEKISKEKKETVMMLRERQAGRAWGVPLKVPSNNGGSPVAGAHYCSHPNGVSVWLKEHRIHWIEHHLN